MKLLGFSKSETWFVIFTLLVIFLFTFFNLQTAIRRSRDFQRKEDVNNITKIVSMFQDKYGSLPANTEDGKIVGCNPTTNAVGGLDFEPCPWGDEIMPGVRIPVDPHNHLKRAYRYISNGRRYQVYGSLESSEEPEYENGVIQLNLACGNKTCNFGRASEKVPVNISLEDYEKTLDPKDL